MGETTLKVVLDTNVLISAIGWHGPPEKCLDLTVEGKVINFISKEIIEELLTVMDYPKLKFTDDEKERFLEILLTIVANVTTDTYSSFASSSGEPLNSHIH